MTIVRAFVYAVVGMFAFALLGGAVVYVVEPYRMFMPVAVQFGCAGAVVGAIGGAAQSIVEALARRPESDGELV